MISFRSGIDCKDEPSTLMYIQPACISLIYTCSFKAKHLNWLIVLSLHVSSVPE